MGNFQYLNLAIIFILVVTITQATEVGLLFENLIDLFIIFFSALLALSFFEGVARVIQEFVVLNIWMAYLLAFWGIFVLALILQVTIKGWTIGEERLGTFDIIDKAGGILTGIGKGIIISGLFLFTIYLVPLSEGIDRECQFLRQSVIFHIDGVLPRLYGYFVKDSRGYNPREFGLRYHHSYTMERTREEERRKAQEAEREKFLKQFYGR